MLFNSKTNFKTWALAGCALSIMSAAPAIAQSNAVFSFEIEEKELGDALTDYGIATGQQVFFNDADVRGKSANSVEGTYTSVQAVELLLKDTGVDYRVDSNGTLLVGKQYVREASLSGQESNQIVLAQADQTPVTPVQPAVSNEAPEEDEQRVEDTIVVTGSLIRGTRSSVGSRTVTLGGEEIEIGGFGNVEEALQSLPSIFKGGINEDARSTATVDNVSGGSSVNLRGLGVGNTLTLLNGRRLAPGGGQTGSFVDISSLPASIVERVEVLADGASATYGSDAVAGVVNVFLRTDYDGAETNLRFGSVTDGGSQEIRASQIFGKNWNTGNLLVSYEYYKRDSLGYEERDFTSTSDLTRLGGDDFRSAQGGVPGNILDPTTRQPSIAIPNGQDGTNLLPTDLIFGTPNLFNENPSFNLLLDRERHNAFVAVSQSVSPEIELFAEGWYSDLSFEDRIGSFPFTLTVPNTNAFFVDPFGGSSSVQVAYNLSPDLAQVGFRGNEGERRSYYGVAGARVDLWSDWQAQVYASISQEERESVADNLDFGAINAALADPDPQSAFNVFGDGSFAQNPATVRSFVLPLSQEGESSLASLNLVLDGTAFKIPGGDVKVALGANFDRYSLDSFAETVSIGDIESSFDRDVFAVFAEVQLPIVGEENAIPGIEQLVLSVSGRYEDYDDIGSTTNPKIGLNWTPRSGLTVRGTYGTSFRAPDLVELDTANNLILQFPLPDPQSTTGTSFGLLLTGGNSSLENETAETWTLGFDAEPNGTDLQFGATYYNISFEDRITSAIVAGPGVLLQEDRFGAAVFRNPSLDDVAAICASGGRFLNRGLGDCETTPVDVIADLRLINAAITETSGLDAYVNYRFETASIGEFLWQTSATHILEFDEAFGPGSPVIELVDTIGNPIDFTLRSGVTWRPNNDISLSAFLNYSDSYEDNVSTVNRDIGSWTTFDLALALNPSGDKTLLGLEGLRATINARNLFDEDPPFANNQIGVGYDPENASPLGRFVSLSLTKAW